MNKSTAIIAAAIALFGATSAMAQGWPATDFDGMLQQQYQQMNQMGQQMQGLQQNITQGAMNDPQVQMAYQQFLAQGGQQDFATWAYNYRGTNGYDPRLVQQQYQQQGANTAAEQNAWAQYQAAQRNSAGAIANWQNGYANNQYQAGMSLQGQQVYTDPTGAQVGMSYMPNAGPMYNPQNGYTYVPNGNGSYIAYDANGYAYQMPYGQ